MDVPSLAFSLVLSFMSVQSQFLNGSQFPANCSQFPANGSEFPANCSEFPANCSHFPANDSQFPANDSQFPANGSQFPADYCANQSESEIEEKEIELHVNVSVTLQGDEITYPFLIYHHEITFGVAPSTVGELNLEGDIICRSENHLKAQWRSPSGAILKTRLSNYKQIHREPDSLPSLSQLSTPYNGASPSFSDNTAVNGLWLCQVDNSSATLSEEEILESFKFVGIYNRGGGKINTNTVSQVDRSDIMPNISFILTGDTKGGPPVINSWSRDGNLISNGGGYHISLKVNEVDTLDVESVSQVLRNCHYRSTLTVTGYLPGLYEYSVQNKAMNKALTANYAIQGGSLTNISATQINLTHVLITWIEPPTDYQISVHNPGGSIEIYSGEPPYIYEIKEVGVHTIRDIYSSKNLLSPGIMVTVKGLGTVTISIVSKTSVSASISWRPPKFHLPVIEYMVTLTRVTGSSPRQELCPEYEDNRPTVTTSATSMSFTDLEEFSTYTVNIITTFDVFGSDVVYETPGIIMFTTLSAAPAGVPHDVTIVSATSRRFMVTWDTIKCIKRNGIILRYAVDSDHNATSRIIGRTFSAERLTPGRQYKFRVAGVNDADTGPFTNTITITLDEEVPGPVSNLMAFGIFRSVDLTWDSPQYMNGVIISYEVTYMVSRVNLIVNTTNTTFSIPQLKPKTTVSGLSVRAYTKIGYGDTTKIADQITLGKSIVKNVRVKRLSPTAVRVLWNSVAIPEITGYIVYYSETKGKFELSITVDSSNTSVDIEGLLENIKYHFWVAVIASVNGKEFVGELPQVFSLCSRNCGVVIFIIFSYLVIMILASILTFYTAPERIANSPALHSLSVLLFSHA